MNPARLLGPLSRHPLLADVVLAAPVAALAAATGVALVAPRAQAPPPTLTFVLWAVAWLRR
jgi:hypothetical protein